MSLMFTELPQRSTLIQVDVRQQVRCLVEDMIGEVQLRVAAGPFQNYFINSPSLVNKLIKMNAKYSQNTQAQVASDIVQGNIRLPKKKKHLNPKDYPSPSQIVKKQHQSLKQRRQSVVDSLKEVCQEEVEFIHKNASLLKEQFASSRKKDGLSDNPQWRQDIKKGLQKYKKFKEQIKQKAKNVDDMIDQQKHDINTSWLRRVQSDRVLHHKQMQIKKKKYQDFKQKDQQIKKKTQEFVLKIKPSKYKHQAIRQQILNRKNSEQNMCRGTINRHKFASQANIWSQIKQHEEKCINGLEERRQLWIETVRQKMKSITHRRFTSVFTERIREEQAQKIEERVALRQHQILQKMKKYDHYVREKIHVRVQKPKDEKSPNHKVRNCLTRMQSRNVGLKYLDQIKKQVTIFKEKTGSLPSLKASDVHKDKAVIKTGQKTGVSANYKDYLRQQPKRSVNQTASDRFHSVIAARNDNWAQSACGLISQKQGGKKGDKGMLKSAFSKIQLLNALM